jgi:ABC-type antimicrobial peptide transport system permease subunit
VAFKMNDPESQLRAAQINQLFGVALAGDPPKGRLLAGRYLNNGDTGKNYIVIPYLEELDRIGVKVGSRFTYYIRSQNREVTFEVVGIVAPSALSGLIPFSMADGIVQAPLDVFTRSTPFDPIIASVRPEALNRVLAQVGTIPGIFVFDISVFDSIVSRLLNQLAALPLLVAGLSLFAAAVLIASTVSLVTIERRRQIGVLKAVGVSRWQTLFQLLLENGIIGFAGGVISLLPTLIILQAVPALTFNLIVLPVPLDLIAGMIVLAVAITLLATLLTAWNASGERPLEALRYE